MDHATIKQRKTSKQQTEVELDDSDEEAAYYETFEKQKGGAVSIDGVDANLFSKNITAPSTFVIILLIAVLVLLAYEFGNLQKQINTLHKENKEQLKVEHRLKDQLKTLKREVNGVMHEEITLAHKESMLEIKENRLEKEMNEGHDGVHHHGETDSIDLHPLKKHQPNDNLNLLGQGIRGLFENSMNLLKQAAPNFKETYDNIQKRKKNEENKRKHTHDTIDNMKHQIDEQIHQRHEHEKHEREKHEHQKHEQHNQHKPEHHQQQQKIPKPIKID